MPGKKKPPPIPVNLRTGGLPAHFPNRGWGNANNVLDRKTVLKYLKQNPNLINEYIVESAEMDVLEELLREKKKIASPSALLPKAVAPYAQVATKDVGSILTTELSEQKFHGTIEKFCQILSQALKADYNIYIPDIHASARVYSLKNGELGFASLEGTVSGHALESKKTVMVDSLPGNER